MKIPVELNTKSIKNAVKSLEMARKQLNDKMVEELLIACCDRIIHRANENLDGLDLGENVKRGIQGSWEISKTDNGYKLTNDWHEEHGQWIMGAAFVEFGTGVKGDDSHPEASEAGYQYNMPSESKGALGGWSFFTEETNLDLPTSDYTILRKFGGNRLLIGTFGTESTRFLYNAVMDFDSNNEAQALWQEIKAKYWG